MPARSIGTATISFGLVSVPVSIYSASESKASVSFNMLHKKCGTRLKQQYICPKDNNEATVRIWETVSDREVGSFTADVGSVICLAFSPDKKALALACDNKTIRVFKFRTTHVDTCDQTGATTSKRSGRSLRAASIKSAPATVAWIGLGSSRYDLATRLRSPAVALRRRCLNFSRSTRV